MKNLFLLFSMLTITNMNLCAEDLKARVDEFPKKEMIAQSQTIADLVAKEISTTLPQAVDKYTSLVSIKAKEQTLVYTFEINSGAKSDETIKKEDKSRMKENITEGVCQSSRKFLESGINTSYIYINATTKASLFQFDISLQDCTRYLQ
ncbi:MAG: hypothetical protein PHU40_02285 [Sulfurimonas sp.]|nr:hypothetical protein [Sulfurimonas sp.]